MAELIISEAGKEINRVPVFGLLVEIGRKSDNNVVLEDPDVSRRHALIEKEGDYYYLKDIGSANGTVVNGQKISSRVRLADLDRIEIGRFTLTFSQGEGLDVSHESKTRVRKVKSFQKQKEPVKRVEPETPKRTAILRSPLSGKLVFDSGRYRGEEKEIWDGATIGRNKTNDIIIDDPTVSSTHARFQVVNNMIRIADLGSTNGTYINGERVIDSQTVYDQDLIAFGKATAKLVQIGGKKREQIKESGEKKARKKKGYVPYILSAAAVVLIAVTVGFFVSHHQSQKNLEKMITIARQDIESHKFKPAQKILANVLKMNPSNLEADRLKTRANNGLRALAKFKEADGLKNKGKIDEVRVRLEEAERLFPGLPQVQSLLSQIKSEEELLREAKNLLDSKMYEEAKSRFVMVLDKDKKNQIAISGLVSIGDIYLSNRQYDNAKSIVEKALTFDSANIRALQLRKDILAGISHDQDVTRRIGTLEKRIRSYYSQNRLNDAFSSTQQLLKIQPGNSIALQSLKNIKASLRKSVPKHFQMGDLSRVDQELKLLRSIERSSPLINKYTNLASRIRQVNKLIEDGTLESGRKNFTAAEEKYNLALTMLTGIRNEAPGSSFIDSKIENCKEKIKGLGANVPEKVLSQVKSLMAAAEKDKKDYEDYGRSIDPALAKWKQVVEKLPPNHKLRVQAEKYLKRYTK